VTRTVYWWACILAVMTLIGACGHSPAPLWQDVHPPPAAEPPPPADPADDRASVVPRTGGRLITACDHGNRLYQDTEDSAAGRPVVIPRDPTCLDANGNPR
jgi:hypothetical protein